MPQNSRTISAQVADERAGHRINYRASAGVRDRESDHAINISSSCSGEQAN